MMKYVMACFPIYKRLSINSLNIEYFEGKLLLFDYKYMQPNATYGTCDVPPISPPPPAVAPPTIVEEASHQPVQEEFHVDTPLKLVKFLWVMWGVKNFLT